MKAVVLGSGGWGTALSQVLCDNGHDVTLWSHNPDKAADMAENAGKSSAKGVCACRMLCTSPATLPAWKGRRWWVRGALLRCAGDRAEARALPAVGRCWCPYPRESSGIPTCA